MKQITVTINRDGTTEIDVNGVKGSGCEQYTQAILKALGGVVISDEKKPEYYEQSTNTVSTKN